MKSKGLAFGCHMVGAALALVASAQPWWRGLGDGVAVKVTGSQATGGLSQALAIVALAATLLMLALRNRGRRVVAALLLLVGVGTALTGGSWLQPRPDAVRGQLGHGGIFDDLGLTPTAWPWIYALAGVVIAAGAVVTMISAVSWPNGSDRFQKEPGKVQASEDPAELWKA
ncbi:MAG TPA: Trp biosynthesis-associated membrane protein, partial [Propionibacteriaceae bacterium]|nr:Trp biosynthesis-associated membrane protein [Propionibacteriaceae bacterium]